MRLNRLTDYAVILLTRLSFTPKEGEAATADGFILKTTAQLAADTAVPAPTTSKTLKLLATAGLVTAQRGAAGGYALARAAAEISVADIILAIEGPIALTACVDGSDDSCAAESFCSMSGNWDEVNRSVLAALQNVRLPDMAPDADWPFGKFEDSTVAVAKRHQEAAAHGSN